MREMRLAFSLVTVENDSLYSRPQARTHVEAYSVRKGCLI